MFHILVSLRFDKKHVNDQQAAADTDGHVRHIENRPESEIQKIHHIAVDGPVDEISHASRRNERQGEQQAPMILPAPFYKVRQYSRDDDKLHRDQESRFILEHAEGGAAVVDICDVEYPVGQGDGTVQLHIGADQVFRQLVQRNSESDDDEIQWRNPFSLS